jgi:hypothetical protein
LSKVATAPRTRGPLRWERDWEVEGRRVTQASRRLENLVRESTRTVGEGEEAAFAFGQWIGAPEDKERGRGQHGIYGTAAGLEVVSRGRQSEGDLKVIDGCWSYLRPRLADGPERMRQSYIVLRQAMVLRSLSALNWTLTHRSPKVAVTGSEVRALAEELLGELRRAKEDEEGRGPVRIWVNWSSAGRETTEVRGFRFASTSPDVPTFANTWAFHQAAVLTAVTAAFRCGLLSEPEDHLVADHVATLTRWCGQVLGEDPADPVMLRVAMYAGWAIQGLPFGQAANEEERDSLAALYDALEPEDRNALVKGLKGAVRSVLGDPALQTDLHLPFLYRMREDGRPVDPDVEETYRQEHLVVPTVPITISLTARLGGRLRFDRGHLALVSKVCGCLEATKPTVVPAQPTAANGTVNFAYLRVALRDVERCFGELATESLRQRLVQRYPIWGMLKAFLTSKFGLLLAGAFLSAVVADLLGLL